MIASHPSLPARRTTMERRQFIKQVVQTAAVASVSALSAQRVFGANERVNVALIGCGTRGMTVARLMRQAPNVAFPAVCDVYQPNAATAQKWGGAGCEAYGDFRQVL